jgi:hypothetical protein
MIPRGKKNAAAASRSNTEIRSIVLRYFYDRNVSATSARGKKGYAVRISDVRKELTASHGLSQQEVMSNLNYLLSQGWVEEDKVEKSVPLPSGTVIPNTTSYYKVTAAGIDKIEGPGEFTMEKFRGIKSRLPVRTSLRSATATRLTPSTKMSLGHSSN